MNRNDGKNFQNPKIYIIISKDVDLLKKYKLQNTILLKSLIFLDIFDIFHCSIRCASNYHSDETFFFSISVRTNGIAFWENMAKLNILSVIAFK